MKHLSILVAQRSGCVFVVAALGLALVAGCGGDAPPGPAELGTGAQSDAAIESLATFSHLLAPAGESFGVEAAGEVLDETMGGLAELPDTGGGGGLNVGCPAGGRAEVSCAVEAGDSVWHVVTEQCRLCRAGGQRRCLTFGGAVTARLSGGGCQVAAIRSGLTSFDVQAEGLSIELSLADGTRLALVNADGTLSADGQGWGCSIPNGTLILDGSLSLLVPGRGIDVWFAADQLVVSGGSSGRPCTISGVVDGGLTVADQRSGRRFDGTFAGFSVGITPAGNRTADVTLDGGLSTPCSGPMEVDTLAPVHLRLARACPTSGTLELRSEGRATSSVSFTETGGVEIDLNGDGTIDRTRSKCTQSSGSCSGN